jgi:hypothetical protein
VVECFYWSCVYLQWKVRHPFWCFVGVEVAHAVSY